jgi:hypothetical protein
VSDDREIAGSLDRQIVTRDGRIVDDTKGASWRR